MTRVLTGLLFGLTASLTAQAPPSAEGIRVRTVADTLIGGVGGVTVDGLGIIYVADFGERVYKVHPDGRVSVFATGLYGSSGNAIDSQGRLLQSSFTGNFIARIERDGEVSILARGLEGPVGLAVDSSDNAYVTNCRGNALSRVTPHGKVEPFSESSLFNCPNGITFGPDGNLYVVNFRDPRVLAVDATGEVSVLAQLPGGGNGHIASARGALYATSFQSHRIYRIGLDGEVTHVAGTGAIGEANGDGPSATFSWPNGIAAGPQGDRLYVNDFINRFPPTVEVPPVPLSSLRQITLPSFSRILAGALRAGGLDSLRIRYRAWKDDPNTSGIFTELEVNGLGYQLMSQGQLEPAIAVFELNTESYPNAFNTYDSLGEAYMNAGRREEAIANYRKSLDLNPANVNAAAKLKELGAH